jgi:DNA-directed RNA polymerase delta subunit
LDAELEFGCRVEFGLRNWVAKLDWKKRSKTIRQAKQKEQGGGTINADKERRQTKQEDKQRKKTNKKEEQKAERKEKRQKLSFVALVLRLVLRLCSDN